MNYDETYAGIREVLVAHANLSVDIAQIGEATDLFAAGMTSLSTVNVMLDLEDRFGIEFPDSMMRREMFASVEVMAEAVQSLLSRAA